METNLIDTKVGSVRIVCLAQNAYACIEGDGFTMDVRLAAGHGAAHSLEQLADEHEARAAKLLQSARRARAAAAWLAISHQHPAETASLK